MYGSARGGKISSYLAKKKLGGEINQRGNEFELYYACNLICFFAKNYSSEINRIAISSQVDAFVDDLYINFCNKTHHYYQLKTSRYLNWSSRKTSSATKEKSLSLKFDFWLQSNWCRLKNKKCKLHLVVSEKNVQRQMVLKKPILMHNVEINYFSYENTITKLIFGNIEFRNNLSSLCAIDSPAIDTLVSLASCIIGLWNCSGRENITINDLLANVKSINGSYVKYPLFSSLKISNELDIILKSINNFSYSAESDVFIWKYGKTDYGKSPYSVSSAEFSRFEQEVVRIKPTSFKELENLLIILS